MSYTVLARKYRPQSFDDLVGQEHVARTLANAIASGRVAHAFLFTGVRGVGKTTTARLLAKALNCEKGPTASPCNACPQCEEITSGHDLDVLEMDGASNNSVDDVRRLQESIPYRPARDRSKIIIVDEVHMLSQGAFNAFLKTLEEPPPHVKFIFATTESHKVPVTIRSRCQRYDFRLIPQGIIADRVRHILGAEGVSADDVAVSMVAREAAGSMRDALTLLDQIVAFGGEKLRGKAVAEHLGIANRDLVHQVVRTVLEGDARGVIEAVDGLATQGLDMLHFSKQLLDLMRDLVVVRVTGGDAGALVSMANEELEQARALAEAVDALELQRAFHVMSSLVDDVGRSGTPRTVLEMGLVRLATRPPLRQVSELLARLDELEGQLGGGAKGAAGDEPPRRRGPTGAGKPPSRRASTDTAPKADSASAEPPVDAPDAEPIAPETLPLQSKPKVIQEIPESQQAELAAWESIVLALREARPALAAVLDHGVPVTVSRERIVLAFPEGSFFGKQVEPAEAREGIADAAASVVGGRPDVQVSYTAASPGKTIAEVKDRRREDLKEERRRAAMSHPRVIDAMQLFPEGAANVKVNVDVE